MTRNGGWKALRIIIETISYFVSIFFDTYQSVVLELQGTYLVWVDISKRIQLINLELLSNKVGIIVNSGSIYGKSGEVLLG
jgi:bifunctional pyridoxal-dependent enzyme with beta-cystathionase and maltose regulon repressor activities